MLHRLSRTSQQSCTSLSAATLGSITFMPSASVIATLHLSCRRWTGLKNLSFTRRRRRRRLYRLTTIRSRGIVPCVEIWLGGMLRLLSSKAKLEMLLQWFDCDEPYIFITRQCMGCEVRIDCDCGMSHRVGEMFDYDKLLTGQVTVANNLTPQ